MSNNNTFLIDGRRIVVESCEKKDRNINFSVSVEMGRGMHPASGTYDIDNDRFYFGISIDEHPEKVQRFVLANSREMIDLFGSLGAQTC